MAFDLKQWKSDLKNRFIDWKPRMRSTGAKSVYAFVSAAALWPIAYAYQQSDLAAVMTLGGVLAGLGSNLLANQIQSWKDEADAAQKLAAAVEEDEALRAEIDAVLKKLKALDIAKQALPEDERDWFTETLQHELSAWGKYIVLDGSGAIAIGDNAKAAGERGAIIDAVTGSVVITGEVLGNVYNYYLAPPGKPKLGKAEFERILTEYITWVGKAYNKADLFGVEGMQAAKGRPSKKLLDVFTQISLRRFQPIKRTELEALEEGTKDHLDRKKEYLNLVDQKKEAGDVVQIDDLLRINNRMAVIGGAGSGKSTLLAYLAASLVNQSQFDGEMTISLPEDHKTLVPIIIPLRNFRDYQISAEQSHELKMNQPPTGTLLDFIPWYLARRIGGIDHPRDFFDRLLRGGGCLLMLDGLDEVVTQDDRAQMRLQIEQIANDNYPHNIILVTAREAGYQDDAIFSEDFVRLDVQRLSPAQINTLVLNWCAQLYPAEVKEKADELFGEIEMINNLRADRDLPPLVSNPLMVTMVVSVKWGETELPRERAKLYEAVVKAILLAQYTPPDDARKELVNWGGPWEAQRDWLSLLALEMHRGGRASAAITEEQVREILTETLPAAVLDQFVEAIRYRGGIFEERAELFQFTHLTFQEFLAARLLAKQRSEGLKDLAQNVGEPWWREVLLLLYDYAQMDYTPFSIIYLEWLSQLDQNDEKYLAGLELAASALLEIEKPDIDLRLSQAEKLVLALQKEDSSAPVILRVKAGNTLAALGDPRFDPEAWHLPKDDLLGFVEILSGKFLMGSDPEQDKRFFDRERPQHEPDLDAYYIARYPVTVGQWRVFVKDDKYESNNERSLEGIETHPVRYVSWHDAIAYCRWLDEKLRTWENTPDSLADQLKRGWRVTLPSEAQWEKAARGEDGRIYPWGDEFDKEKTNMVETGIDTTSPVGSFPGGASPYGLLDMSGNVREWCSSLYGKYPYDAKDGREDMTSEGSRVLRGGSFFNDPQFVRCAFRDFGLYPGFRDFDFGFRVIVSPSGSEL